MASLNDLMERTTAASHEKAENSHVIALRPRKGSVRRVTLHLRSTESYSSPAGHFVTVLWPTIPDIRDANFNEKTAHLTPTTARCRAFCTCPAFKFTGPAYHSTVEHWRLPEKAAETRPPVERDPEGVRIVCKHVIRVGRALANTDFTGLAQIFNVRGPIRRGYVELEVLGIEDALPRIGATIRAHTGMTDQQYNRWAKTITDDNWEDEFLQMGLIDPETFDGV